MKKTYTVGGSSAYKIAIPTIMTLASAARALSEHKYENREFDFSILKKRKAIEIIKERFFRHGINGVWEAFSGDGNGLGDTQEELNGYYDEANEWLLKNYPYLGTSK